MRYSLHFIFSLIIILAFPHFICAAPEIVSISSSKQDVEVGETFLVSVKVKNPTSVAEFYDIRALELSGLIWEVLTPENYSYEFAPGQSKTFVFEVRSTLCGTGMIYGQVKLSSETLWDNAAESILLVNADIIPLPEITMVYSSKKELCESERMTVYINVTNTGKCHGLFDIRCIDEGSNNWKTITADQLHVPLFPDETRELTFDIEASKAGTAKITGQAKRWFDSRWDNPYEQSISAAASSPEEPEVSHILASKTKVINGDTINISAQVKNPGQCFGDYEIRAVEHSSLGWQILTSGYQYQRIVGKQYANFNFDVLANKAGTGRIKVQARHDPTIPWAYTSSLIVEVLCEESIGVEDETTSLSTGISISPNPASDFITINFFLKKSNRTKISIIDLLSRNEINLPGQAFEAGRCSVNLDINELPQGVYIIKAEGESFNAINKFIVYR